VILAFFDVFDFFGEFGRDEDGVLVVACFWYQVQI
jgi:hypothetical protein